MSSEAGVGEFARGCATWYPLPTDYEVSVFVFTKLTLPRYCAATSFLSNNEGMAILETRNYESTFQAIDSGEGILVRHNACGTCFSH